MKRITFIKSAMMVLAIVVAFGFNSCIKDDVVTPNGGSQPMIGVDYNAPSNYVMATYNAEENFVPATTETEMEYVDAVGDGGRPPMPPKGLFLGDIFRRMKVTREQMKEFHVFIVAFEKCSREAQSLPQEEIRAMIKVANEQVRAIIAKVRSGEITREAAKPLIEQINKALRERLEASVDQQARCECLRELFRKIYSKLTDEQKALWDAWKAKLENPCLGVSQ
jgi:hypothetical protein